MLLSELAVSTRSKLMRGETCFEVVTSYCQHADVVVVVVVVVLVVVLVLVLVLVE